MKRFFWIFAVVMVVLAAGVVGVVRMVGQKGSGTIEQWIGSQVQFIANSYINPTLEFSDLDYQYPLTVSLKNMRLTADDPATPGKKIEILGCNSATLELAEIPSVGKPIVVEKITLDTPTFSAVAISPGSKEFVGFSDLVRAGAIAPSTQDSAKPVSEKLSDILRLRLVELRHGQIRYDPRLPNTIPMELNEINTTLALDPHSQGWHRINVTIARDPVFKLKVAGLIDLDRLIGYELDISLTADLNEDSLDYLPPEMQKLLRAHEVKGHLSAALTGYAPLLDPQKGELHAKASIKDSNITLDEYRIPVSSMDLSADLKDEVLEVPEFKVAALQGWTALSGRVNLKTERMDGQVNLQISEMRLEELLAHRNNAEPPSLAGKVDANMQFNAPLRVVYEKARPATQPADRSPLVNESLPGLWGAGSLTVTDAKLVRLPVIHNIVDTISSAAKLGKSDAAAQQKPNERVMLTFDAGGDQLNLSNVTYIGQFVAARGKGNVKLDQSLDLIVNAGPIEKVQQLLGDQVGGAMAIVTDRLVAYKVTGTAEKPVVQVQVGGGIIGNVEKGASSGVQQITEGAKNIGKSIGNIFSPNK